MKKYNRPATRTAALFFCAALSFGSLTSMAQAICGAVVENFDQAGGSTAGFTGDFQLATDGADGYLTKNKIVASGVYSITSPTYQLPASATSIGIGFLLNGTERVARAEVVVSYISTLTNELTKVFLGQFVPTYFPGANSASICRAIDLSDLPGFPAGGQYRFRIELTPNSGGGASSETIAFNDFRTNGTIAAIPLPVAFLDFEAKKATAGVQLTWEVGGEENVAFYEVEKSADGRHFSPIGRVSSSGKDTYTYTDAASSSLSYYRIKNVDKDGRFKYSLIARLSGSKSEIVLKAYPQPARNTITLEHAAVDGQALIQLSGADGRVVRSIVPSAGSRQTAIDLTGLQSGIYLLRFRGSEGGPQTLKVIKQ